jgi:hypothetical protein
MRAVALIHHRVVLAADAFVEIAIWRLSAEVPPSSHLFKYRLAYVVRGECVLRYDNERGKGGHRHVGERELKCQFSTPEKLIADFEADVMRWNLENGRS